MSELENKGAFLEALEYIIDENMKLKSKLLKKIIDDNISITGPEVSHLLFGDYTEFAKRFEETSDDSKKVK